MNFNIKENKGITLIALVITIVILLILSAVTISTLTGDNGLLARAEYSKEESEKAQIKENIILDIYTEQSANDGDISDSQLKSILEKYGDINYEDDGTTIKGITTEDGYEILLSDVYSVETTEDSTLLADGSWNSEKGVNSPELMTGMTGVYWDTDGNEVEVTAENQDNWYDYSEQRWANAKTEDGSYWVWIPRYAYKITSQLYAGMYLTSSTTAGTIEVAFLQGTTNYDSEGNEIDTEYPTVTDYAMDDYVVHPSFTDGTDNNYMNGEWDEEIPGFWVAKYLAGFQAWTADSSDATTVVNSSDKVVYSTKTYTSASYYVYSTSTYWKINAFSQDLTKDGYSSEYISYPVFKPFTYGYNMISTGDSYTISREIAKSSFYGLSSSETDSHMMKNSEWGAVAYLTQSKYGRNKTEISSNKMSVTTYLYTNSLLYLTGYTEKTAAVDDSTSGASSTGNMSGVFDLSGNMEEMTSAYITNGNAVLAYGSSYVATTEADEYGYLTLSTKYATVYPDTYDEYLGLKSSTYGYGDAMIETFYWDGSLGIFYEGSYFCRSGQYGGSYPIGIFGFFSGSSEGIACYTTGFRSVLIPI